MPNINDSHSKTMSDGSKVTYYTNTVGTEAEVYTFSSKQEWVRLKNKGTSQIAYTIGTKSGVLQPSEWILVTESISQFTVSSTKNSQQFEVFADKEGSELSSSGTVDLTNINNRLDALESAGGQTVESTSSIKSSSTLRKPMISFILDDTAAIHYDNLQVWLDRGFRYTTGLRLDFIDSYLTYAKIREMQDKGIEIAYHGTFHNYPIETLDADITQFMSIAKTEKLNIRGYVGANGMYDEKVVFHNHFSTFKWARGSGATNGVANVRDSVDFFKLINSSFIDDLTSEATLTTLKSKIDALATKGTGFLSLSMHVIPTSLPYLTSLLDYIKSKNIQVVTVSEAYETYGAVLEMYDDTLTLGDDFLVRRDGNGGVSINAASNHFILKKDGELISNSAGMKLITPVHKGVARTGNTTPTGFPVGVTIIQYGSTDNRAGFPTLGTVYNFNLGKNPSEQFQLFKAYNKEGLYLRESTTGNVWKSTFDKLGVFRTTKPTSPTSTGVQGDFSADASYLYVCVADNSWIRVAKDNTWV